MKEESIEQETLSKRKKFLKWFGWTLFFLTFLLFFTYLRIPKQRLKAYGESMAIQTLSRQGYLLDLNDTELSFGLGISYTAKKIKITPIRPPGPPIELENLSLTPHLLSSLLGTPSGDIEVQQGRGILEMSISHDGSITHLDFEAKHLNLKKLGIFPRYTQVKGTAVLEGRGSIEGDFKRPSTLEGDVRVELKTLLVEQQSVFGFQIPRLDISEGIVSARMSQSKLKINNFKLGKKGKKPEDDLIAKITGDIRLGSRWNSSQLNLTAEFSLSKKVQQAFSLVGAILAPGKRKDGSYRFNLTGKVSQPLPMPHP
ncbi:MAG: type II secretion system protein GspN [Bdellovibrionaceae bacterium]|nr:type II secretion system protein GspN [Pseudobdellovibrionaceae bacterium]|tara:strand:+ start:165 stop:1103 length:939 start_codon:yes stop_codon:yes gene_type:complete